MKYFQLLLLAVLISISAIGQNRITGSTTWGTVYVPVDPDFDIDIRDLIGRRELDFGMVSLDGKTNVVKIDAGMVQAEMSSETGGGKVTADLKIIELFVASEGVDAKYNSVGVAGKMFGQEVSFELYFLAGPAAFTGSTVGNPEKMPETFYKLKFSDKRGTRKEYGTFKHTIPTSVSLDNKYLGKYCDEFPFIVEKRGERFYFSFHNGVKAEIKSTDKSSESIYDKNYDFCAFSEEYGVRNGVDGGFWGGIVYMNFGEEESRQWIEIQCLWGQYYNQKCFKTGSSIPTDELIAYYPFSNNSNDESGNGFHASVFGAQLTADRFGNAHSAYSFDGNDYIQVSKSLNLNYEAAISVWVKSSDFYGENGSYIYTSDDLINQGGHKFGYAVIMFPSGIIRIAHGTGTDNYSSVQSIPSTPNPVVLNTWHHIVASFGQFSSGEIYIDGKKQEIEAHQTSNRTVSFNLGKDRIGTDSKNINCGFKGIIDDIRVYRRCLNEKEVEALFNESDVSSVMAEVEKELEEQLGFQVKILDGYNMPLEGITVFVQDNFQSKEAITDENGVAEFQVYDNQLLKIGAADLTGKDRYSIVGGTAQSGKDENIELTIPDFPYKAAYAAQDIDNMIMTMSAAFDMISLSEIDDAIKAGKSLSFSNYGGAGIPGVFSVMPVPVRGDDGRLYLVITGELAKRLSKFTQITSPTYMVGYQLEGKEF